METWWPYFFHGAQCASGPGKEKACSEVAPIG